MGVIFTPPGVNEKRYRLWNYYDSRLLIEGVLTTVFLQKRFRRLTPRLFGLVFLFFGIAIQSASAATCTVDSTSVQQTIRGFGASCAWAGTNYSTTIADTLWLDDTVNGHVGLTMLRQRIPTDSNFGYGVGILQEARDRGVSQIWATEWSCPPAMKSNGTTVGGYLNPSSYGAYASYLASYATTLKNTYAVTLIAISPFNEPDLLTAYESCTMTGAGIHDFIAQMGATFAAVTFADGTKVNSTTRIIMPEPSNIANLPSLGDPTMNDTTTRAYVWAAATHLYYYNASLVVPYANLNGKEFWETEVYDQVNANEDLGMGSGFVTFDRIQNSMANANMTCFHYWWIQNSNSTDNGGLYDSNGNASKRLYVLGNFSKFVRPGYTRIASTANPATNVYTTAYTSSTAGRFVIVASNNNNVASSVTFNLTGFTSTGAVTIWVTDPNNNLVNSGTIAPTGGVSFVYSMPVSSVVSFVGSSSSFGPTATPTRTGTPTPTYSPTRTPIPGAFCLIDDFEDGNTTNKWGGTWASYADSTSSLIFGVSTGGAPGSTAYSASVSGTIGSYGGLTCPLGGTMDLSSYTGGVCFYAKGTGVTYWFQMASAAVTDGDNYGQTFVAPTTWTPITILFGAMHQRGFGAPVTFSAATCSMFQFANYSGSVFNLQIDDLKMMGAYCPTTPTFTATPTSTPTLTTTPTRTNTGTSTQTRTNTPTTTSTPTPTSTSTRTNTPTSTATPSPTPTSTSTSTVTVTATPTRTQTSTFTSTSTATMTNTLVNTGTATPTSTRTNTPTATATTTPTRTGTPTSTSTATTTNTVVNTGTSTPTSTRTNTPTTTSTSTPTQTGTPTSSVTSTNTLVNTGTATPTSTRTYTPTVTATSTPTKTGTPTSTSTVTTTNTVVNTGTSHADELRRPRPGLLPILRPRRRQLRQLAL
jgi:glucuronoarabinoxylan endo-1,4-beta-xylanase